MLWDVRCSLKDKSAWAVAKIEQPNRRLSRKDDGDEPEPAPMSFHHLPPRCENVGVAGFGVWSFDLDLDV
jgi:hypothetical protein